MEDKKKFWKYLLFPAIGFAIGGAFWGWECYKITGLTGEFFASSLLFIPSTVLLGIVGGIGIFSIDRTNYQRRKILGLIVVGPAIWFASFLIPIIFFWPMLVIGSIITPIFAVIQIISKIDPVPLIVINYSLPVGQLWFGFLVIGAIISYFYAFILKLKAKPVVWRGAVGAALSAFISPVCGNLIGNHLLHSLLSAYLITFSLIGFIFGLFLGWGLWKAEKKAENAKESI